MKTIDSSVDELKKKIKDKTLEIGTYSGKNASGQNVILVVDANKFSIYTTQGNGWTRVNIYEYDRNDGAWVEEETYEKE